MSNTLEDHVGTVNIGGRTITNLRFADDIDGIAGEENELSRLVNQLDRASTKFGMEISEEKTKLMTNEHGSITTNISVHGQNLHMVQQFKYLVAIIGDQGSKPEVLARAAQTLNALSKLKPIWKDKNISVKCKVRLLRALVLSIFLYACETWTRCTAELQRRIQTLEMRCYHTILGISYLSHTSNDQVRTTIHQHIGLYDDLLTIVKERKLRWYGHVTGSDGLAKTVLQGTVEGRRRREGQRKKWSDNIKEWTKKTFVVTQALAHDRDRWRDLVHNSSRRHKKGTRRRRPYLTRPDPTRPNPTQPNLT
ncbi:hypothetical protein Pcinc_024216 [Petrolisthes cinctipes]|uniref:Reverse transcriptase domain-containing protein n=1 Tax=Petrolisthes cinctipes TaxID=88211 RepID=A0AAE1KEQ9_PETCI|nr:hypothetical protein Pcinc_024216 [Petrolisthes cinctipes]